MDKLIPLSHLWFLLFFVVLSGNIIQGMTGFGAGLVSGPILAIFLAPKLVIVILLVTGISNLILVAYHSRKGVDLRRLRPLVLLAVIGIPFGSYLLMVVSPSVARALIAIVSIGFSTFLLLGYSRRLEREFMASCGFGFISGILTASVGMGGPPIIIFLANQEWPKEVFRATVAFLFLITGTLSLFSHILTGVTTGDRMIIGLSLIPASIIGFYLGDALFEKVSHKLFINVALILILISGITALATSLAKI
ncbi:MAG: sulfite exporter TauE/SafE family protein [Deltaproteobacteria bacterium]|jgi:uncharacterized protein